MVWSPGSFYDRYGTDLTEFCDDMELDVPEEEEAALEDANPDTSYFTPCPLCNSDRIAGMVDQGGEVTHEHLCQTCGCQFSVHTSEPMGDDDNDVEEEDRCRGRCRGGAESIHGLLTICPHCTAVDSIQDHGGTEWCTTCWLQPSELDQVSIEIAPLFKGGIKKALEKGIPILQAGRGVGKFVREECGPHCTFAENCPQTLGNLAKCYNEERECEFGYEKEDSENLGKRKRGKKRKGQKKTRPHYRQQHNRKSYSTGPPKVAFFCSRGGLLEKMVLHGTTDPDTEQPGNTGSQSGA